MLSFAECQVESDATAIKLDNKYNENSSSNNVSLPHQKNSPPQSANEHIRTRASDCDIDGMSQKFMLAEDDEKSLQEAQNQQMPLQKVKAVFSLIVSKALGNSFSFYPYPDQKN